tara:strand:- start:178 stop:753 length:576 start_codon:yes stop_codon:yes gene_type:complete
MTNLGIIGTVAQAGQGSVAAPTGVSIAEAASSGQNNSFKITDEGPDIMTVDYSDWSSATSESFGTQFEREVSAGDLGDFDDYGYIRLSPFAYLRATGATSFSWTNSVYADNFGTGSGDPSSSVGGNSNNSQDATGSGGTGTYFQITPGSGRGGGNNWPTNGDYVIFKLTGTATNSGGSTTADLYLRYSFTG